MALTGNHMHAFNRLDFLGGDLRVAPGDNDAGTRMLPLQLPDQLAGLHGSLLGDRARIDDAHICCLTLVRSLPTMSVQAGGKDVRFVLVDFATQCGYGKLQFKQSDMSLVVKKYISI
jgi:hypothetical protein